MFKRLALDVPGTEPLVDKKDEPSYQASISEDLDDGATDYLAFGDFHTVPDQLPPSSNRKMRTGPSDPDIDSDPDLNAV